MNVIVLFVAFLSGYIDADDIRKILIKFVLHYDFQSLHISNNSNYHSKN
jgi:hypothetical protein